MDDLIRLVGLSLVSNLGGVTLRALLGRFGTLADILAADTEALRQVPGVGPKIAAGIKAINLEQVSGAVSRWQEHGVTLLPWDSPAYPMRLAQLHDAPPVLFARGNLDAVRSKTLAAAIVGTRTPSLVSRQLAEQIAQEFARRDWLIISGMAWGIDMAAHQGALNGGQTVAVLGAGVLAPVGERKHPLIEQVLASDGLLLSEVHPHASASAPQLVARNRLISGLSCIVVVVEAGAQSGSLHAGRQAMRQGRHLFAVRNGSAGNIELLREGAQPLMPTINDWAALARLMETFCAHST